MVESSHYVIGLDLGQSTDYTALVAGEIRRTVVQDSIEPDALPDDPIPTHKSFDLAIGHVERFPLHTPYPAMIAAAGDRVMKLKERGPVLVVIDHTGVGRPVVDMVKQAKWGVALWPVTIATSAMGNARRDQHTGDWIVPKKDLIGAMTQLAHEGRLPIATRVSFASILKEELRTFRMKITADANVTFEAWRREGMHDDLVLALAMACWAAQRWASPGGLI
jgi:hypothetical protein